MATNQLSKIQKKGQVTIPAEYRERLGLKEGVWVAFTETPGGLLISPQEAVAMATLDKIGMALSEQGIDLDDLLESGAKTRNKLTEKKPTTTSYANASKRI